MVRELISKLRARPGSTPPRGAASIEYLRYWGLDKVLTEEDDPELWAAVLYRYWPAPSEPDLDIAGLRFSSGDASYGGGLHAAKAVQEGRISEPDLWCFEAGDDGRLRPVRFAENHETPTLRRSLLLDRPSMGTDSVLIDHFQSGGPLAGGGGNVLWRYSFRRELWEPEKVGTVRMS